MARLTVRGSLLRLIVLWGLLGSAGWGQPASAAVTTADAAISSGRELELRRNWRDAIEHYEEAVKAYPDNEYLTYGLRRAKFQFSVERRYSDDSFQRTLLGLSRAQSLDVFDSVLTKIQGRFVESISTQSIVAHGTESLWLALANDRFLQKNLPTADPARVREVRSILRQQFWNRSPAATGARGMINEVCDTCERLLGLNNTAVVMEYVFGAFNCLDDYSTALTPTRFADLFTNIDGEFVGVGIVMEGKLGNGMELVDVLPESPALEAGLAAGEWIVSIDGIDCRYLSTEEAAQLLTGSAGSRVKLEISGRDNAHRQVHCFRREVKVKSIPVAQLLDSDSGVAYLRMTGFQKHTTEELDRALTTLQRQGMRSLIWDLRGNPGGLLHEAVSVLDRFISEGVLVSTKGRGPDDDETFTAFAPGTWDMPLVVLIDGESASASEIVAGCIFDHHRGTLVGRTSYGKWSVQSIYPSSNGMGVKLTTARFYSPNGNTYSKIGIKPDVAVPAAAPGHARRSSSDPLDPATDADLRAAIEVLSSPTYTRR